MSGKAKYEIFIDTLTEMFEAHRQEKDARHREQSQTYAERFSTQAPDGATGLRKNFGRNP